jgi:hypothetical protein
MKSGRAAFPGEIYTMRAKIAVGLMALTLLTLAASAHLARYSIVATHSERVGYFRLDRWTGRVDICNSANCYPFPSNQESQKDE